VICNKYIIQAYNPPISHNDGSEKKQTSNIHRSNLHWSSLGWNPEKEYAHLLYKKFKRRNDQKTDKIK